MSDSDTPEAPELTHAEETEEEILVDDGASFAEIAKAHSAAILAEKTVQVEDIDGVVGGLAAPVDEVASARKVREGMVVSNKMDKTAIVVATDRVRHRRYNKTVQRDKRLYVHDETNDMNVGDRVRIVETRPLSKNKRWRLLEVLERAR